MVQIFSLFINHELLEDKYILNELQTIFEKLPLSSKNDPDFLVVWANLAFA